MPVIRKQRKVLKREDIEKVIGRTWFDIEESDDRFLLSTRDNGSVYDEEPGKQDLDEGRRILKAIRKKWAWEGRKSNLEVVDEWVHVEVFIRGRSDEELQTMRQRAADKEAYERMKLAAEAAKEKFQSELGEGFYTPVRVDGMHIIVAFGERYLYLDRGRYIHKNSEAAMAFAQEFMAQFPDMEFEEPRFGQDTRLHEHVTFNYRPPNNVIERAGKLVWSYSAKV